MKYKLVKLDKLCKIQSGGTPRRGVDGYYEGEIPWAKIGDIENAQNSYLINTNESITATGLKSINNKIFPVNTVLLAMYGSVGKTAIAGTQMSVNQAILGLQPNNPNELYFKYLKYWLDYSKESLIGKARGVALQNISATIVKNIEFPLVGIEDQKSIVQILDEADSLRQKRKQAIEYLDEYLKSIFMEMFGDPVKNTKGWNVEPLKKLCHEIADIDHNMPKATSSGYPFISAKDLLDDGSISFKNVKYISEKDFLRLSRKIKPKKGDIIYSRIGAKLGKSRIVNVDFDFLASYSCCTIRPIKDKVSTVFLNHLLNTPFLLRQALSDVRAIGVPDLGMDKIREFKIIIPPLDLQTKFSSITENAELLKNKMIEQFFELENYYQAMMQKSFQIS